MQVLKIQSVPEHLQQQQPQQAILSLKICVTLAAIFSFRSAVISLRIIHTQTVENTLKRSEQSTQKFLPWFL